MKYILFLSVMLCVTGCTNSTKTKQIVENAGYTNVVMDGFSLFGCSEDDFFRDKFTAKSPNGNIVNGVVCGGFLKGYTIRLD